MNQKAKAYHWISTKDFEQRNFEPKVENGHIVIRGELEPGETHTYYLEPQ